MLGFEPNIYFKATWMVLTPITLLVSKVMSLCLNINFKKVGYFNYMFLCNKIHPSYKFITLTMQVSFSFHLLDKN